MIINWFALYPNRDPNQGFVYPRIFFCYALIMAQIICILMLFVVNGLTTFLNASHFAVINITLLSKLAFFLSSGDKFKQVEIHLDTIKGKDVPENVIDHIGKEEYTRNRLGYPQRLMILGALILSICLCLVFRKDRPLILLSWFPYELETAFNYYLTLLMQAMVFASSGLPNASMDIAYYVLVDIACAQMDIVMCNFTDLDPRNSSAEIYKDVRKNIIYHCQVIRFIKIVQNIYSKIIFAQCIGSVTVICILGFQLAVTVKFPSTDFLMQALFLGSMVFQIFCYCWFGQKFLLKSQEVAQACYMSKWNEFDSKTKKMLCIVMTRSVCPIILSAGIFTQTLETFVMILRSSYSFMAVLRTMYSE